jgi:two-component system, LytTR family, sensor kinase
MRVERRDSRKRQIKWTPILAWVVVIAAGIAVGLIARRPPLVGRGGTPLYPRIPGPPPDFRALLELLGVGSVSWYTILIALPFLFWAARALGTSARNRAQQGAIYGLGAAGLVVVTTTIQYFVTYRGAGMRPPFGRFLPVALLQNVLPWIAVIAVVAAIEARRRTVRAVVERERLRAQIAEQQLKALTGQLQPHFLFNTLQGISTLIHRDPETADEMLTKLSDLLRALLRHRDEALITLEEEIQYVRTYLEIAQLRFAERLAFEIDVPRDASQAAVPLFILQPLVENALAHGIGANLKGGRVRIIARRSDNKVELTVSDDGLGLDHAVEMREGVGLSNTRERLRASFGDSSRLTISRGNDGGVVARIDMPFVSQSKGHA